MEGFCPSFVTVLNAEPKKMSGVDFAALEEKIPPPTQKIGAHATMIAGIGGTGVITVGAVLSRAAYLDGLVSSTYDMTGLAQKNGAVFSHLRIAPTTEELGPQRVGGDEADLVLAFDLLAALQDQSSKTIRTDHTALVGNGDVAVTSFFQLDRTEAGRPREGDANERLSQATGADRYAMQKGFLPVSLKAVQEAIQHNGIAVEFNQNALLVGRILAHDPALLDSFLPTPKPDGPKTLDEFIAFHTQRLSAFQNAAWAKKYNAVVSEVRARKGDGDFTMAVVNYLAKLMSYKDEYEVARLYSAPEFKEALRDTFGNKGQLRFNLAPPLFARRHPDTGHLIKKEFGPWMLKAFGALSRLKGLRGTAFDIFGYTEERRSERRMIEEYIAVITDILQLAQGHDKALAQQIAELPDMVRGYGHVKEKNMANYEARKTQLLQRLQQSKPENVAAE